MNDTYQRCIYKFIKQLKQYRRDKYIRTINAYHKIYFANKKRHPFTY